MTAMDRDIIVVFLLAAAAFVAMLVLAVSDEEPECNATTVAHQVLPK